MYCLVPQEEYPFKIRLRAVVYFTNDPGVSERRRANDGIMYACEEFIEYYGPVQGIKRWNAATERCYPLQDLLDPDVLMLQVQRAERRRALDGSLCMCGEFLSRHGDTRGAWLWYLATVMVPRQPVILAITPDGPAIADIEV